MERSMCGTERVAWRWLYWMVNTLDPSPACSLTPNSWLSPARALTWLSGYQPLTTNEFYPWPTSITGIFDEKTCMPSTALPPPGRKWCCFLCSCRGWFQCIHLIPFRWRTFPFYSDADIFRLHHCFSFGVTTACIHRCSAVTRRVFFFLIYITLCTMNTTCCGYRLFIFCVYRQTFAVNYTLKPWSGVCPSCPVHSHQYFHCSGGSFCF